MPDGQDPDDLVRTQGPEALARVVETARPLVEVLWNREVEAGPLDTPERRAALDRRLNEVLREIKDETLRGYYRDDIRARLDVLRGKGPRDQRGGGRQPFQPRAGGQAFKGGRFAPPPPQGYVSQPLTGSPALQKTQTFASGSGASMREAQIVLTLMNHPILLARHLEDLADLEFESRDAARLRNALTALAAEAIDNPEQLRAELDVIGLGPERGRFESMSMVANLWCVTAAAAEEDAEQSLRQALALHRRARALHKELKSAETALGQDATEQNLDRLREIQAELAALEGREAALEGFGLMSGRQTRAL